MFWNSPLLLKTVVVQSPSQFFCHFAKSLFDELTARCFRVFRCPCIRVSIFRNGTWVRCVRLHETQPLTVCFPRVNSGLSNRLVPSVQCLAPMKCVRCVRLHETQTFAVWFRREKTRRTKRPVLPTFSCLRILCGNLGAVG